jgi:1-acyl-sn-glycerol-3-phosphate acyltransferase
MFGAICVFFFKLLGWKIKGDFPGPEVPKYIIIVAPHTSYWDYPIGVAVRRMKKLDAKYLAKKELFSFPPLGWFFKSMGGYPVDRGKKGSLTDAIVDLLNSKERFAITITPEGTRSKVEKWKTGFYIIAQKANLPIVKVAFDFANKQVVIEAPENITGDMEADIARYKDYYRGFKGKRPELGVD